MACNAKIFHAKRYIMLREFVRSSNEMYKIMCSTLVIKLISTEYNGHILFVDFRFLAQF